jgi:hypothetical protein
MKNCFSSPAENAVNGREARYAAEDAEFANSHHWPAEESQLVRIHEGSVNDSRRGGLQIKMVAAMFDLGSATIERIHRDAAAAKWLMEDELS